MVKQRVLTSALHVHRQCVEALKRL